MLDQNDHTLFLERKRRTLKLLALLSNGLTPAQKTGVNEFISNNELRLAVEFIVDFISENDSLISSEAFRLVEELMVDLKSDRSYTHLRSLVASAA